MLRNFNVGCVVAQRNAPPQLPAPMANQSMKALLSAFVADNLMHDSLDFLK